MNRREMFLFFVGRKNKKLKILEYLQTVKDASTTEIAKALESPINTVSDNLNLLREVRLVDFRKQNFNEGEEYKPAEKRWFTKIEEISFDMSMGKRVDLHLLLIVLTLGMTFVFLFFNNYGGAIGMLIIMISVFFVRQRYYFSVK